LHFFSFFAFFWGKKKIKQEEKPLLKLEAAMDPHHNEPIHDGEPNDVKSTHIPKDDKPQPLSGDGASPG
jgi:hypothetical protein